MMHRAQFLRNRNSIVKIQAAVRVYLAKDAKKRLLLERNHSKASKLQSWARMNASNRTFTSTIHAAVKLQSCARGFLSRLYLRRLLRLAHLLQCHVRHFLERQRLVQEAATLLRVRRKAAASSLVRWWRRAARLSHRRHAACVMLQTGSRAYLARRQLRNLQQLNSRAVVLQLWWRMLKAEMTNRSILLLQKCIRRFIAERTFTKKMEDARREHMAAHRIQTLWRTTVRNRIKRSAVTVLQAHYRMVCAHRLFQTRRSHCIKIQSFARRCLVTWSNKNNNLVSEPLRSASFPTIQSWMRMNPSKCDFHVVVKAVVKVQAAVRRFLVRKRFQEKLRLISWIQTNFRNRKDTQHCTALRLCMHQLATEPSTCEGLSDTVVLIQSIWRGQLGRRRSKLMFESTRNRHNSAVAIQSAVRSFQRRHELTRLLGAGHMIQSVWRQRSVANVLKLHNDKARVLQCFWRGHTARITFDTMVSYQHGHRSTLCREGHAKICAKSKRTVATTRIQNQWRTHRTTKHAATRIQTLFRVSRESRRFRLQRKAMMRIQCFIRVCQARSCVKKAKASRLLQYTAAESIQRMFRGHDARTEISARRLNFAATSITSGWRGKLEREKFHAKIAAIVLIQAQFRAFSARKSLSCLDTSCAMIQALARGVSYRNKIAAVRAQQMADEVLLQDNLKTMKLQTTRSDRINLENAEVEPDWPFQQVDLTTAGKHRLSVYDAACRIQSLWSRTRSPRFSREVMRYAESGNNKISDSSIACAAVQLLQRHVKAYLDRLTFLKQQRSAVVIQSHWRGLVEQRKLDNFTALPTLVPACILAMQREDSAFRLQKWWRRQTHRRSLVEQRELNDFSTLPTNVPACVLAMQREDSAFRLQKWWRRQRHVSSYWIRQRLPELQNMERTGTHPCAVSFGSATRSPLQSSPKDQACVQESLARQMVLDQRHAATTIQSFWRTAWEHHKLEALSIRLTHVSRYVVVLRREDKAIRLQKWWRRWRIQSPYLARRREAAHCLQRLHGSWKMKRDVSRLQCAVDLLERGVFGSLSRSMACFGLLQANTVIAGHRVHPRITHRQHVWLDLQAQLRRLVATLIQAVYRGYRSRLRTSISARHFWPCMRSRPIVRHAPTTMPTFRRSPMNVPCGDAYRARVEQKALDVVVAYASAEAEMVVMRHRAT